HHHPPRDARSGAGPPRTAQRAPDRRADLGLPRLRAAPGGRGRSYSRRRCRCHRRRRCGARLSATLQGGTPMLGYYTRLALRSFARTPGIPGLRGRARAPGIGVCIMPLTVFHAMSGNPIWGKNDRLYAVTMDNWDPTQAADKKHPELPPPLMTYKDARYVAGSDIPERKVIMYTVDATLSGAGVAPLRTDTRMTMGDFFAMFDVPFLYGGGWSKTADNPPQPVIVLSRKTNDKLFGGANSVGRVLRWNDHEFRVV